MNYKELINSNIKNDMVETFAEIDWSSFSREELMILKEWINTTRRQADSKTLEDEVVGHTYRNLNALISQFPIKMEDSSKMGIKTKIYSQSCASK